MLIVCLMSGLEKELENVARNVSTLSKSGDEFAEQEDQIADQISTMKQRHGNLLLNFLVIKTFFSRFREDEVRAEMAEREVQKLQKEVDKLEAQVLSEKTKLKQMDDDMEGILSSINSI